MAGERESAAVRPINILTTLSWPLYRFEGSQEPSTRTLRVRLHLENCTGKTFRGSTEARGHPVEARARTCGNSQIRLSSHLNSLRNGMIVEARSSEEERRVDAKALIADEGRDKLRKVLGSCK